MPIAAVPDYLGRLDLSTASPGLRFGMYLPLWGRNNRTGEVDWSTKDTNYRVTGRQRQEREFHDDNKRDALKQTTRMTEADNRHLEAIIERQSALAAPIAASGQLLTIDARSVAPFTTGLGNEHPLENGFAFLNPYGLPYLPGSGVKGVLRQAARELAGVNSGEQWQIESDWTGDTIDALFGKEESSDARRGALDFWDVIPQLKGNSLEVEVMTAHQRHYYQQGESPHESGQPNPINFLTVPPGSGFTFHVVCDCPFLARIAPDLSGNDRWKMLLREAFEHAFDWLGFGAKTAVGYGAMQVDEAARQRREEAEQRAKAQAERERELARISADLPEDAAWIESQRVNDGWLDTNVFLDLLEKFIEGRDFLTTEALQRLEVEMQQRWKGIMENPDAIQGKKRKPKFKSRPKELAKRLMQLKGEI